MTKAAPGDRARPLSADDASELAAGMTAAYLAIALAPMIWYTRSTDDFGPLLIHAAVLAYVGVLMCTSATRVRVLRDWLPLMLLPFLYIEQRWLIEAIGRPHSDAMVRRWEDALFAGNPSHTLAPRFQRVVVSELLHLAYLSYYAIIYLPPAVLYVRKERRAFGVTMLALTVAYCVCFAVYPLFPVDGPRFLAGPAAAPDGPVRALVLRILDAGSSRGTAFPSSHVAASVVASFCALRFQRAAGVVVSTVTALLAVATVYGGFHYAVDATAGVIVGLAAYWVATRVTA